MCPVLCTCEFRGCFPRSVFPGLLNLQPFCPELVPPSGGTGIHLWGHWFEQADRGGFPCPRQNLFAGFPWEFWESPGGVLVNALPACESGL